MEESPMRSDLRSLLRTRAHDLNAFVTKLDRFLTYLFLGPAGQGMLLRDVLETGIRYYHEHAEHGDAVDIAAFMAASISVAATGICVYRVTGNRSNLQVVWSPQDEGGIQRFVADNQLESIQFEQVAPTNAHRAAAKDRVHALLCTWEEAVALQRAGFDYRRYDAF